MPSRPCSPPAAKPVRVRKGVALSAPVARLRIRIRPFCCTINNRPESPGGAVTKSGWVRPEATRIASSPGTICARRPGNEIAARIKEQIVALIVRSILPVAIRSLILFRIHPAKCKDVNHRGSREQTALSTSIETMQGRDAVVFLEIRRFGGDLCRVEFDLFGIFLSLDFDEAAFDRLFHRFGQIT